MGFVPQDDIVHEQLTVRERLGHRDGMWSCAFVAGGSEFHVLWEWLLGLRDASRAVGRLVAFGCGSLGAPVAWAKIANGCVVKCREVLFPLLRPFPESTSLSWLPGQTCAVTKSECLGTSSSPPSCGIRTRLQQSCLRKSWRTAFRGVPWHMCDAPRGWFEAEGPFLALRLKKQPFGRESKPMVPS